MFLIISEIYLFLFRTHVNIRRFLATNNGVVYDVKGVLNKECIDGRLYNE